MRYIPVGGGSWDKEKGPKNDLKDGPLHIKSEGNQGDAHPHLKALFAHKVHTS